MISKVSRQQKVVCHRILVICVVWAGCSYSVTLV